MLRWKTPTDRTHSSGGRKSDIETFQLTSSRSTIRYFPNDSGIRDKITCWKLCRARIVMSGHTLHLHNWKMISKIGCANGDKCIYDGKKMRWDLTWLEFSKVTSYVRFISAFSSLFLTSWRHFKSSFGSRKNWREVVLWPDCVICPILRSWRNS